MKIFLDALFFLIIGYYCVSFIQVLIRMESKVILPTTPEERAVIRKHPEKPLAPPKYSKQKLGIIIYSGVLMFVISMYFISLTFNEINWSIYLLLSIPLTNSSDLFNLFAISNDGVLSGIRFIPWKRMKSYQFITIDMNHRFYGFSKEVNNRYELKIKTKGFPVSLVVTSDEMKEKLDNILREHIYGTEKITVVKES